MTMVSSGGGEVHNFEFALKSRHFLDKVLSIEIVPDNASTADGSPRLQQAHITSDGPLLPADGPLLPADGLPRQNQQLLNAEGLAREQQGPITGDEPPRQLKRKRVSDCNDDSPETPLRVKSIRVSSVVLAYKSKFFEKLFTSEMRESLEEKYTMRITQKEEKPLEQLLEFIYKHKFTTTDPELLIDILVAADKFSVMNAVDYCCSVLINLPMSTEAAKLYLELPSSSIVVDNALKNLRVLAGQFLVKEFREIRKSEPVLLEMPLSVIRSIFSSSEILVPSEDYVFNFLMKWAVKRYGNNEQSFTVFNLHLVPLVRFYHMSAMNLKKLLVCNLLDQRKAPMLVINSLLSRSDIGNRLPIEIEQHLLEQRVYHMKPIRVFDFSRPFQHSVIYVDFSKADLENLSKFPDIVTEAFLVSGQKFYLKVRLSEEPAGSGTQRFGMFLSSLNVAGPLTLKARFSARRKDGDFVTLYDFRAVYTASMSMGILDLFRAPWEQFTVNGNHLIDDFLYLRAEVKQQV